VSILWFHIERVRKAGGLWRDEAAAVQLATMPSVKEVVHYFPHEAFPLLFPAIVRTYSVVAGNADLAWRVFGLLVGTGILAGLWWNLRSTGRGVPLLSLALLGFNGAFLQWGDSMRGYGLGIVLMLFCAGLIWRLVEYPASPVWEESSKFRVQSSKSGQQRRGRRGGRGSGGYLVPFQAIPNFRRRFLLAAAVAVASVQCLLHNSVLLLAICIGAMVVTIARKRASRRPKIDPDQPDAKPRGEPFRPLDFQYLITYSVENPAFMMVLLVGVVAAISLIPYVVPLSQARAWDIVIRLPVTLDDLSTKLNHALSSSFAWNAWVWALLLVGAFVACLVEVIRVQSSKFKVQSSEGGVQGSDSAVLLFSATILFVGVLVYFAFLLFLSYPTEPWYYMALMALVALFVDVGFHTLGRRNTALQIGRLVLTLVLAALAFGPTLRQSKVRMTNVDLVAAMLNQRVEKDDLVVVAPWNIGISFSRYYHGAAPWVTAPPLEFHRFHRYDLVKTLMMSQDQSEPIRPLLDQIRETLKRGNHVWVVGGVKFLPKMGEQLPELAPAPDPKYGWLNEVYSAQWAVKVVSYVQVIAVKTDTVPVDVGGEVNSFEDLPLKRGEGWAGL
jgi:hypothetical protein